MFEFVMQKPEEIRILINGQWQHVPADVQIEWKENQLLVSAHTTRIESIGLRWKTAFCSGARFFGDAWERGYGDLGWTGMMPEKLHPWYLLIREGDQCSFIGVKTGCNAFVGFLADSDSITMLADTRSGCEGVDLHNRTLPVCTLVTTFNQPEDAYAFLQKQLRLLCDAPLMPKTPIYGGNNWYYAYGRSSRDQILSDTSFILEMSQGLENRPFMVIDDGWQLNADNQVTNGGPWIGNKRFGDMQDLAHHMKDMGARPGLWYRPLLIDGKVKPEWILSAQQIGVLIDPSHPEVLEYVKETTRTLAGWGYELLKHDFTTCDLMGTWGNKLNGNRFGKPQKVFDTSRTNAEHVIRLYDAIREGAGSAMVLGCNTVSHLAAGKVEIQRTGDDTSGKAWERTRRMGINTLAMRMPQHGAFYAVDADCVGSTDQVPWSLNKQWLDLLSRSGTPLFVSADAKYQRAEQRDAIREAFKIASEPHECAQPLDWQDTTCPALWKTFDGEHRFHWNNWYDPEPNPVYWR